MVNKLEINSEKADFGAVCTVTPCILQVQEM
jgi:hypothetical protein